MMRNNPTFLPGWIILFVVFILPSCTSIRPPEFLGIEVEKFRLMEDKRFKIDLAITMSNVNAAPFNISISNLKIYKLDDQFIKAVDIEVYNFENFEVTNMAPISEMGKPRKYVLAPTTNTTVKLNMIFQRDVVLTSVISLIFNQEIHLLFKGKIVYHHWSGGYPFRFNEYYNFDLKKLIK